jgi:hypothetical protein
LIAQFESTKASIGTTEIVTEIHGFCKAENECGYDIFKVKVSYGSKSRLTWVKTTQLKDSHHLLKLFQTSILIPTELSRSPESQSVLNTTALPADLEIVGDGWSEVSIHTDETFQVQHTAAPIARDDEELYGLEEDNLPKDPIVRSTSSQSTDLEAQNNKSSLIWYYDRPWVEISFLRRSLPESFFSTRRVKRSQGIYSSVSVSILPKRLKSHDTNGVTYLTVQIASL